MKKNPCIPFNFKVEGAIGAAQHRTSTGTTKRKERKPRRDVGTDCDRAADEHREDGEDITGSGIRIGGGHERGRGTDAARRAPT